MPSPVAHALAGVAVYAALAPGAGPRRDWQPWVLAACAAMAADLDFLPGLLVSQPGRWHHWATHSVTAAIVFTLLVTPLAVRGLPGRGRRAAVLLAAYGSHLVLDWLTVDRTVPQGIPLAWPLSEAVFLSPLPLFTDIHHGATWEAFVNWHNAGAALRETLLLGLPVAAFCVLRLRRPAAEAH